MWGFKRVSIGCFVVIIFRNLAPNDHFYTTYMHILVLVTWQSRYRSCADNFSSIRLWKSTWRSRDITNDHVKAYTVITSYHVECQLQVYLRRASKPSSRGLPSWLPRVSHVVQCQECLGSHVRLSTCFKTRRVGCHVAREARWGQSECVQRPFRHPCTSHVIWRHGHVVGISKGAGMLGWSSGMSRDRSGGSRGVT